MKPSRKTTENACRLFLILALMLAFFCSGCSENPNWSGGEEEVTYENGKIVTEFFKAHPGGTVIHAFGGDVILEFLPGTVPTTTRYSLVSFPVDHLDFHGKNVMMRAFSIENVTNENTFGQPVKVLMRYDLCNYTLCDPGEESALAIYKYIGDSYAVHKIEALGECCMDCSCKTVMGCIEECGAYIVVEE